MKYKLPHYAILSVLVWGSLISYSHAGILATQPVATSSFNGPGNGWISQCFDTSIAPFLNATLDRAEFYSSNLDPSLGVNLEVYGYPNTTCTGGVYSFQQQINLDTTPALTRKKMTIDFTNISLAGTSSIIFRFNESTGGGNPNTYGRSIDNTPYYQIYSAGDTLTWINPNGDGDSFTYLRNWELNFLTSSTATSGRLIISGEDASGDGYLFGSNFVITSTTSPFLLTIPFPEDWYDGTYTANAWVYINDDLNSSAGEITFNIYNSGYTGVGTSTPSRGSCLGESTFFGFGMCWALSFIFMPSESAIDKFASLPDHFRNTPPLSYIAEFRSNITNIQNTSTSSTSIIIPMPALTTTTPFTINLQLAVNQFPQIFTTITSWIETLMWIVWSVLIAIYVFSILNFKP